MYFRKFERNERGWFFLHFVFTLVYEKVSYLSFSFSWEDSWFFRGRKLKYKGLQSLLSQTWNMRMLIRSNPYALLRFNFLVTVIPLDTNLIKWSNTLKKFLKFCRRIVWVCLNISWGWRLTLIWVGLFRGLSWGGEVWVKLHSLTKTR